MKYAICTVSAAVVRREPNHRSEIVNQLLFGDKMEVLEEKEEWFRIKSTYDDYEGWLTYHLIKEIDEATALKDVNFYTTGLVNELHFSNQLMNIPLGASLTGFDEKTKFLWNKSFEYKGAYRKASEIFDKGFLLTTAYSLLNAPYLWGAKTLMGIDCSGFVQTVFKVNGIKLKRDAYQQAEQGTAVENLLSAKELDLAFFQNTQGKIIHVGIILENNQIVHASGKVRIDTIDEEGIVNSDTGKRTHQLHSIRRVTSF